ncbi:MAG: hypothetical protein ACLQBX_06875 [Candidatus Limnocylindrales bacterium]
MLGQPSTPNYDEVAPISRLPWLTPRRLIFFVIGWLIVFSLGSVLISNPFQSETSASATPIFWHVLYLHGMQIGMVGLLALLACSVLGLRSLHTRMWIVGGVLFATVLAAIGGIWDRQIPGAEVPMWVQIFGFFALDEILIVLLAGMVAEWRSGAAKARSLPYLAAFLATVSMFVAALMGHLAGWILEFGNSPSVIGWYAGVIGVNLDTFSANLIGSHSHEMVVGVMALTVSIAAAQFGYATLEGPARRIAGVGLAMVGFGALAMTALYLVMGFTAWGPPNLFTSANGGIAGDDIVTGVFVMTGGLLVLLPVVFGSARARAVAGHPVRIASAWSWLLMFATVVVAGYAIELNTSYFGGGDPKAAGAANDAVFTWLHQDIGLFLMPALVLVMLAVERLVVERHRDVIGWATIAGTTVTFVGGMVFVFVNPAIHGPGYDISTVGLLIVGVALLATMWYGALRHATAAFPAVGARLGSAGGHGR